MVLGNITPCRCLTTIITQELIYTCRWLRSYINVDGLNSDGALPHWQLCWSHYRWRIRLQDWLHGGDEFSLAFKVNYISEDLLLGMVTSCSFYFLFFINTYPSPMSSRTPPLQYHPWPKPIKSMFHIYHIFPSKVSFHNGTDMDWHLQNRSIGTWADLEFCHIK